MFKVNRNRLFLPLAGLAITLAAAPAAFGANCQDFKLTVKNSTPDEIKIKKIEYRDEGVWRVENALGIDGFKKLQPGHAETFTRDFEKVGGETTRFRITYAHHHGGSEWDKDIVKESSSVTCNDKDDLTVTLTQ